MLLDNKPLTGQETSQLLAGNYVLKEAETDRMRVTVCGVFVCVWKCVTASDVPV